MEKRRAKREEQQKWCQVKREYVNMFETAAKEFGAKWEITEQILIWLAYFQPLFPRLWNPRMLGRRRVRQYEAWYKWAGDMLAFDSINEMKQAIERLHGHTYYEQINTYSHVLVLVYHELKNVITEALFHHLQEVPELVQMVQMYLDLPHPRKYQDNAWLKACQRTYNADTRIECMLFGVKRYVPIALSY